MLDGDGVDDLFEDLRVFVSVADELDDVVGVVLGDDPLRGQEDSEDPIAVILRVPIQKHPQQPAHIKQIQIISNPPSHNTQLPNTIPHDPTHLRLITNISHQRILTFILIVDLPKVKELFSPTS